MLLTENTVLIPAKTFWWLCVVCFAFAGSGTLIFKSYSRWSSSPVLLTFATTETPIWKVPFPAVTICPQTKANHSIFNYTNVYLKHLHKQHVTEEEEQYYNLYSVMCETGDEYVKLKPNMTNANQDILRLVLSFNELKTAHCKWCGHRYDCNDILTRTLTSEGWCVTFNMLDHDDVYVDSANVTEHKNQCRLNENKWTLESGYQSDDMEVYPRRTMLAGVKTGFQLDLLAFDDELDYMCSDLQGFKVSVHLPTEAPNMDRHFLIPLNSAVLANVKPSMITKFDNIEDYSVKDRGCYLPEEGLLRRYKTYTQDNCLAECLRNYTESLCGCVGFEMAGYEDVEFCGADRKECMNDVKRHLLELELTLQKAFSGDVNKMPELCNCLPPCTSISYFVDTTQTDWNWRRTYHFRNFNFGTKFDPKKDHMSRLVVYFSDLQFLTSERHELTTVVDFLASCGGLMGLFCGFSVTSFLEIFDYLTLRLICNLTKFGRKVWSGDKQLIDAGNR